MSNLYMLIFFVLLFFSSLLMVTGLMILLGDLVYMIEWELFNINGSEVIYLILVDYITLIFLSVVLFISSVVVYYSLSYMAMDSNKDRFILLVLMFVISMMFMIISPNLISILLGWDGLGLVSFCLVIFYMNVKSYNAGMLTVLSNRIGDVMIILSIAWLLNDGSWNLILFESFMNEGGLKENILGVFLMIAGFTKSAQIPFSAWLPAAMAAPTPVSSLVHSSTLVTAGVYLFIRFFNFLSQVFIFQFILMLGCMTMFMSGLMANYEFDLKKIIALSTLSQLGLMISILGQGFVDLAFFHLLIHAFFKALLFLCAGMLIHNFKDLQDIRYMGMISKLMPIVSSCFLISNLALCGFPFLAGFYSKDMILDYYSMSELNIFIYIFFYLSMGLTVSYSVRLVYYCFFMNINFYKMINLYDEDKIMMKSIIVLTLMSVLGGSNMMWLMFNFYQSVYMEMSMKLMIIFMMVVGGLLGFMFSWMNLKKSYKLEYFLFFFIGNMWFLNFLSVGGMNLKILHFSFYLVKILEFGWLEYLVSLNFFQKIIFYIGYMFKIEKNFIKIYLMMFLGWILLFYYFIVMN
uniref:NADH-ubiquinone oxidoreductase chain 5 n=1 Tax=Marilia sp. XG-2021 TaxID=2996736 RepID=A0A9E8RUT0_9NEOP|nr:NADH dehydrogenase subunit 5 [Marilia sp. XG-2021]